MKHVLSESEFNMWRAVFAFSVVDHVLSIEEQRLLKSYKEKVDFSDEQLDIIGDDFKKEQDVESLYKKITGKEDKKRFCVLARAMAWCDGGIDDQEIAILKRVACLKAPPESEILAATRGHSHVTHYYERYAKAGVVGLFDLPHQLDLVS